jgi:adenylate kinase family enzyme
MRLLITGGPGSGCTTTAEKISQELGVPVFDSDSFFHKPSDPPFQESYSPEERRLMLDSALSKKPSWIVSGSVATWGLSSFKPAHGVLLNVPKTVRLQRLVQRQRDQFGPRIEVGGDMHDEHEAFIEWAADYEERSGIGRNLATDREFLLHQCDRFMNIDQMADIDAIAGKIMRFLSNTNHA